MILRFEGTTETEVGNFHINENNVIIGVVVRKSDTNFSVCISGETQVKLPFALSTTNTQPFFLDKTTGLISLFTSTEQGNSEKVIGFLYGCEANIVQVRETQTIDDQQIEVVVSETSTIVEKQINELHTAFVEI